MTETTSEGGIIENRKSKEATVEEYDTRALAEAVAEATWDMKARNVRVLDVRGIVSYTDYIIVCHGTSERHAQSIARHIVDELRPVKVRPSSIEGLSSGEWILVDFVDVVAHIFFEPFRSEYAIESIYSDAPRLDLSPPEELEEETAQPSADSDLDAGEDDTFK